MQENPTSGGEAEGGQRLRRGVCRSPWLTAWHKTGPSWLRVVGYLREQIPPQWVCQIIRSWDRHIHHKLLHSAGVYQMWP